MISNEMKVILDVYIDFFREIVNKQQGLLDLKQPGIASLSRKIMLRDLKSEPERIFNLYLSFVSH